MSLDDLFEIMSWPIGERDPFRPSVRMHVTRVVFTICLKALLDGGSAAKLPASVTGSVFLQSLRATYAQHMGASRQVRRKSGVWRRGIREIVCLLGNCSRFPEMHGRRRFRAQLRAKMEFFVPTVPRK